MYVGFQLILVSEEIASTSSVIICVTSGLNLANAIVYGFGFTGFVQSWFKS